MDARFVTLKNNNNMQITHVGSHFSLGSTAQSKLLVISRILAEFLVYAIIQLIRVSGAFFPAIRIFQIADLGFSFIDLSSRPRPTRRCKLLYAIAYTDRIAHH